jgi:hypothetical protein
VVQLEQENVYPKGPKLIRIFGDPDKLSSTVYEFTNIYGTKKCTVLLTYIAPCEFVGTVKVIYNARNGHSETDWYLKSRIDIKHKNILYGIYPII